MEKEFKTKTVFVQNLPFTTTNDQLEELFSDIGPLKKCFVVAKKDNKASCKGVGFVTFASEDDTSAVLKRSLHLGGRKLILSLAGENVNRSKLKKRKRSEAEEKKNDSIGEVPAAQIKEGKAAKKVENVSREAAARTVVVLGVTDEKKVTDSAGNPKSIRKLSFSAGANGEKSATVLYRGKKDAIVAVRRFLRNKMAASVLGSEMNEKSNSTDANPKKSRLIVRNLAFKCEESDLRNVFEEFGDITEVNIPKNVNGKKLGFGMVQFSLVEAAARAVEEVNGKSILGRPVAVDWSLPKSKYEKLNQQTETNYLDKKKKTVSEKKKTEDDEDEDNKVEYDEEEMDDEEEEVGEENEVSDDEDDKLNSFFVHDSDDEEREDDDVDDDEGAKVSDDDDSDESDESNEEDSDDESENEEDKDESDDSSDSEPKAKRRKTEKTKPVQRKQDVDQGRTVFIRNLSFESMEEDLGEYMEEHFGEVTCCRIVTDKNMEHSKGTAFVQFKTKEQAERCIYDSSSMDGLVLDGRKLLVSLALPKEKADELKSHQNKEKVDKRNLHLIRVGLIRPGTQEAAGLSKADLVKRMKVETITRQKLKNPNVFVSATRLCIRNIPVSVDDKSLRKTFLKACGNPKGKITECRIMRDLDRVGNNGLGKSRGYGFINFETHEDAIAALTATNNNPEIYGESRRLIVEFSLENKSALLTQQRRLERNQAVKETPKSTKFQPKIVPLTVNYKKGLPSHWGPKIRHKARPNQKTTSTTKHKTTETEEKQKASKKRKHKTKRRNTNEARDNLDELISNYRRKFAAV